MVKSRPNFSAISSRHFTVSPAGQTIMIAAGPVPQQQLLGDQAGLDGLAEADVVGEQQVDPGRVHRPGDRLELVVLDRDAGAERRLQRLDVGRGHRRPADRVEERGQPLRRVEPVLGHLGQRAAGQHLPAGLDLPDDVEGVAVAAVLHALQADQGAVLAGLDVADHPALAANLHQVSELGRLVVALGTAPPCVCLARLPRPPQQALPPRECFFTRSVRHGRRRRGPPEWPCN